MLKREAPPDTRRVPLKGPTTELYNLDDDIGEQKNLADQHPDKVKALTKRMEEIDGAISSAIRERGSVK